MRSVSVRIRPPGPKENADDVAWASDTSSMWAVSRKDSRYQVDRIYGPDWDTEAIYRDRFWPLIGKVIGGFNCTVFAYGQTSSGKTYTIQGTEKSPGVVPLAVRDIFATIAEHTKREFLVRVSYMEVRIARGCRLVECF